MKRIVCIIAALIAVAGSLSVSARAYRTYTYNAYNEPTDSPDVYTVSFTSDGKALGTGELNSPTDITSGNDGNIYITDCKNNRIIKLDSEYRMVHVYTEFSFEGKKQTLNSPTNVFVSTDGTLYISDNGNRRILVCNNNGEIRRILTKPESELFPQDKEFLPEDLVVTGTGVLYVLCDGIYQGAVVFDENLNFTGFYGSNTVEPTLKIITENLWKKLATKEQRSKMSRYVPVQYSSLDIDEEDFVYTCVASSKSPGGRIKKLNPLGNNILNGTDGKELFFGDYEPYEYNGKSCYSSLESISVCEKTVFAALDRTDAKVFLYSREGDLLSVFGGHGSFKGCFADPVALTFNGSDIVVLDGKKGCFTVFTLTEYGAALYNAIDVYMDGRFSESLPLWQEVLRYDAGSYLANLGYGKALYQFGEYKQAMEYFELSGDRAHYSEAYKEYRNEKLKKNIGLYFTSALVVAVIAVFGIKSGMFKKIGKAVYRHIRSKKRRKQG